MQVLVNNQGIRYKNYRPYIDREEDLYNVSLYDPYRDYNTGLYARSQPDCQSWQKHFITNNMGLRGGILSFNRPNQYTINNVNGKHVNISEKIFLSMKR